MHFPFVFRALFGKVLPLFALLVCLTGGNAHAATYTFGGATVSGCTLADKVYTCPGATLPGEYDIAVINTGYTVNVRSNVTFGYNQGLTMSGTARLTSTGNLNIADINPANLNITGGSFSAANTFSVGNQVHKLTANITAGTLMLGSGSGLQITGSVAATGAVQIGSNTTINGPVSGASISIGTPVKIYGAVTSTGPVQIGSYAVIEGAVQGTTINADSPLTLKGNVTATARFALGSGSTVTGSITAPEVDLYSSGSTISGDVAASKFLNVGATVKIGGNVDTGQLKMEASDALISGNAAVEFATLYWHGRVAKKITCKSGTAAGTCDCVDNQSGYAVNSAEGPTCVSGKPPSSPLHHFMITHDGSGRTCAPETVKVTACSNAACTSVFTGGANVTLQPGGAVASIGSSGTATSEVSRNTAGIVGLTLTQNGSTLNNTTCTTGSTSSCQMNFAGGVSFTIAVPNHGAGEAVTASITAKAVDESNGQCVAAFKSETKAVQYSCQHATTSSDTKGLTAATATLACTTGAKQGISSSFDANGTAKLALTYQDVGQLKLMAELDDAKGDTTFIVTPYTFSFTKLPTPPVRAGDPFNVTVAAWNKSGAVTPSFNRSTLATGATVTTVDMGCVPVGVAGQLAAVALEFDKGVGTASMSWSEVGKMDLKATSTDFLGSKLTVVGTSAGNNAGCLAKVGPFIPKYFQVEQTTVARPFYYAGESIPVTVSAMNAQGVITRNYAAATGLSEIVTLSAFDDTGATENPGNGKLSDSTIAAAKFTSGVAQAAPKYQTDTPPIHVKKLRLRAGSPAPVTSNDATGAYEKARPNVYSGRVRVGNVFGRVGQQVALPLEAHFWTGKSWLLNTLDDFTTIPASAFTQRATGKIADQAPQIVPVANAVQFNDGKAIVQLTSNRAGWIDMAINLGDDTTLLTCGDLGFAASTGAKLAFLRVPTGCRDPMGRATFGEAAPEVRRLIHVREVFN